jgi:hypothetical protein
MHLRTYPPRKVGEKSALFNISEDEKGKKKYSCLSFPTPKRNVTKQDESGRNWTN